MNLSAFRTPSGTLAFGFGESFSLDGLGLRELGSDSSSILGDLLPPACPRRGMRTAPLPGFAAVSGELCCDGEGDEAHADPRGDIDEAADTGGLTLRPMRLANAGRGLALDDEPREGGVG